MTTPAPPPRPTQPWLSISLASPNDIRSWSYGSIETSQIFDRSTQRFHDRGPFSETIFGPIRDCHCACGKLRGHEHFAAVCDECRVSVRPRIVRSQRMGHIELPLPVLHPWFHGHDRAMFELLLGVSARRLRGLLDRRRFIGPDHSGPWVRPVIGDEQLALDCGEPTLDRFLASSGAQAVRTLVESLDFVALCKLLEDYQDHLKFPDIASAALAAWFASPAAVLGVIGSERRLDARLDVIRRVARRGLIPSNAVLEVLPVIPAGHRLGRATSEGRIQLDSITASYRRVLKACADVRGALDVLADAGPTWPPVEQRSGLVRRERRLRKEIASLFDELLRGSVASGAALDRGRRGRRFAKRVEFSARAPLVPDASLPLYACRVPQAQVLDVLVRPFRPDGSLMEIVYGDQLLVEATNRPLVLSMAPARGTLPTLLALHPRPARDGAVRVHPAVAATVGRPFADLSATIHLPISAQAAEDCDRLSFPLAAMRDPVGGDRRLAVAADAVVGCYYATWRSDEVSEHRHTLSSRFYPQHPRTLIFASLDDVRDAWERDRISLFDFVALRLPAGQEVVRRREGDPEALQPPYQLPTTAGRALINGLLPAGSPFYDLPFDRNLLQRVLDKVLQEHGSFVAARFAEAVWALGLRVLTRSGLSCGYVDLAPPATWTKRVDELSREVAKRHRLYERGVIGLTEQYNAITTDVYEARQRINRDHYDALETKPQLNLLFAVVAGQQALSSDSLSRLTGIVGTLWPPGRGRLPMHISSCLSRGLDMRSYFQLAQDGRRRLMRAALPALAPWRLERRIMSALADVTVTIDDCGAQAGVEVRRDVADDKGATFAALLTGRVILHNLYRVGQPGVIVNAGELISRKQALEIVANHISHARVRSPLECRAAEGVCRRCYGADPATGQLIELHSAVGVKAALAIAPTVGAIYDTPSPWLRDPLVDDFVVATAPGLVSHSNVKTIVRDKRRVVISTGGSVDVFDENSRPIRHPVPQGVELYIETGASVERGTVLTSRTRSPRTILAPHDGVVRVERGDRAGLGALVSLIDANGAVVDACLLPPDATLQVADGQTVAAGDVLAKFKLPYTNKLAVANGRFVRLRRLLEGRSRAPRALLAEVDGDVELRPEPELQRHAILIHPPHGGPPAATHVAWREGRLIVVRTGQKVAVGDALTWGDVSPADLVRLRGDRAMRPRLWADIEEQLAALENKRPLDQRPWELLLGQMLRYVEVQSPGDSQLAVGAVLSRGAVEATNRSLRRKWRVADRKAYPVPLDADVVSQRIYDFAVSAFAAKHPGKPLPPAQRAWPVGWSCRLLGLRELAERGSYLAARGLRATKSSLVRAALDRRVEQLDRRQHQILAGQCTRPEPAED